MKILLIDDDVNMCKGMSLQLQGEGIACDAVHTGREGVEYAKQNHYDLLILDIMLPDGTGYDVLKRLRMNDVEYPVLVLTDRGELSDKLKGFDYGADDYLTKPFSKEELFARVYAIIRRSKGYADSCLKVGELTINLKEKFVEVKGTRLDLTNTEYKILELLALHKGSTLHKDIFFEHIYAGDMEAPEVKIIDVFVCKIRKKIADMLGYDPEYIQTVWGRGYVLHAPADDENMTAAS